MAAAAWDRRYGARFMDALHVIFTGHTALGADMNALRMGVDGIARRPRLIPSKPPCVPDTALSRLMKSYQFTTAIVGVGWQSVESGLPSGRRVPAPTKAIR
ncbi:hypothetical protein ACNKHS_09790 [Shigella flexneri]